MCRLAAYVGAPAPVATVMFRGGHSLLRQSWAPRELLSGSVNADGYGVSWFSESHGGVRLARSEPAWFDPDLEALLESVHAGVALSALRNATPGLPVDRAGLLPLVHDRWGFVLNGYVPDFRASHMRALRAPLPDALYGALTGVSDSETLFLLTLQALQNGADAVEALVAVERQVASRLGDTAQAPLTMVLASAEGVWALNGGVGAGPRNSLYVAYRPALAPTGSLLASERFDDDPTWRPVPPGAAVTLDAQGAQIIPR